MVVPSVQHEILSDSVLLCVVKHTKICIHEDNQNHEFGSDVVEMVKEYAEEKFDFWKNSISVSTADIDPLCVCEKVILRLQDSFSDRSSSYKTEIRNKTEAYELLVDVTLRQIQIVAPSAIGIFNGLQTLFQIITEQSGSVYVSYIFDFPFYEWRGLHLDSGRHFQSLDFIKKYIETMALYKYNRFHWHLTEDQGWRVEMKQFPELCEIGAWRDVRVESSHQQNQIEHEYSCDICPKPTKRFQGNYGGFYTQKEIAEVIRFAKIRQIEVIPEIDLPGHCLAVLTAFPNLGCTGGPYRVACSWGIFDDVLCPAKEETFEFVEKCLDELCELFPSKYFHIGGDECRKIRWKNCVACQNKINELGLPDEEAFQCYFITRVAKLLYEKYNKVLVGWDEILEGNLPSSDHVVVMAWRDWKYAETAAKNGLKVIGCPVSQCYFDFIQTADKNEPGAFWSKIVLDLESVYSYEAAAGARERILGGQANVWTEYMPCDHAVEYMTFPRACALAEKLWKVDNTLDFPEFRVLLKQHCENVLAPLNISYCQKSF